MKGRNEEKLSREIKDLIELGNVDIGNYQSSINTRGKKKSSSDKQEKHEKNDGLLKRKKEKVEAKKSNENIQAHNLKNDYSNYNSVEMKESLANKSTNQSERINFADEQTQMDDDAIYFQELIQKRTKNLIHYFQRQKGITADMRSILNEWLMLLCSQIGFKRETFHLAITLVDVALSKLDPIPSTKLQLLGVTCLVIAAKFEEIMCPGIEMYAFSTGEAYSAKEIILFEQYLLGIFNWDIKYPTYCMLVNYITLRWDHWVRSNINEDEFFKTLPLFRFNDGSVIFSRLFRCIDLAVLDFEHIKFSIDVLIFSLIYLIVGVYREEFNEGFIEQYICASKDLGVLNNFYCLNEKIDIFLNEYFGNSLNNIAECMIDAGLYFILTKEPSEVSQHQGVSHICYLF